LGKYHTSGGRESSAQVGFAGGKGPKWVPGGTALEGLQTRGGGVSGQKIRESDSRENGVTKMLQWNQCTSGEKRGVAEQPRLSAIFNRPGLPPWLGGTGDENF